MKKILIITCVVLFCFDILFSQNNYTYTKPGFTTFLKNIPGNIRNYTNQAFKLDNTFNITAMAISTGLMIYYDDKLLNASNNLGDKFGWSEQTDWRMEHIGDGYLQLYVTSSLVGYGLWNNDNRALQSASQILESIFASGTIVQLLKHITGRESPFVATTPTGKWKFFPNQIDYHRNVPEHDAYPSGHISSITAMVVVLSENYPEYAFIKPLGYLAIGLNAIGMMNTGVHWMSDYPLGIAIGYGCAKIAVQKGRINTSSTPTTLSNKSLMVSPMINANGNLSIHLSLNL